MTGRVLVARPLRDLYDARLMGLMAVLTNPAGWGREVLREIAWARSALHSDPQRILDLAPIMLPPACDTWHRMGRKTFDGRTLRQAVPDLAQAAGWSIDALLGQAGLGPRFPDSYASLLALYIPTLRQAEREVGSLRKIISR